MILNIIEQIMLFVLPTGIEAFDDEKGDTHSNYSDIIIRTLLMLFGSIVVCMIEAYNLDDHFHLWIFIHWLPKTLAMSFLYFCGSFQYLVNLTQRKVTEAPWYSHLNKISPPDKWGWYRRMDWRLRMAGHGSLIVIGWIYYFS